MMKDTDLKNSRDDKAIIYLPSVLPTYHIFQHLPTKNNQYGDNIIGESFNKDFSKFIQSL